MLFNKSKSNSGYSLIEVIIASSIFSLIALIIYQSLISVNNLISASREKIAAVDLLNSEFELIRNLSYQNVGIIGGIPSGVLSATTTVVRDGREFVVTRVIRNIDDPFDGTIGGSPNDLSPADYKMVQIEISCTNCKSTSDFYAVSKVSPKNLETASTNGALFVRVFDANGNPVPQASVSITNPNLGININDTTNNNGVLQIVDVPPDQNSYRIITTKSGYTTDRTYATSTGNPNPAKMDATVLLQQLTQVSFVIDKVSDLNVKTIDELCSPVSNVPFSLVGTKLIGTSPDVYKWSANYSTNSSGERIVSGVEWDNYKTETSGGFYISGTNPISPISILPDSSQNLDIVVNTNSPSQLLVSVKDISSMLPISDANVRLHGGGFDENKFTNRGFLMQTDWSGGAGQLNFSDPTRFYSTDSNIETSFPQGEIKLYNSVGDYATYGEIVSSIFDTGTTTNWGRVDILPTDQPVLTGANSVRFQIATADENTATTTWNFLGPDGTTTSFYTITNNNLNPVHNGDRYIRYKIILTTDDVSYTPNVSDIFISFSSACLPPGQVIFYGLTNGTYSLDVSASGYVNQTITPIDINSNWSRLDVLLSP